MRDFPASIRFGDLNVPTPIAYLLKLAALRRAGLAVRTGAGSERVQTPANRPKPRLGAPITPPDRSQPPLTRGTLGTPEIRKCRSAPKSHPASLAGHVSRGLWVARLAAANPFRNPTRLTVRPDPATHRVVLLDSS